MKQNKDEISLVRQYLINPHKVGIWCVEFNWLFEQGISTEFKVESEENSGIKTFIPRKYEPTELFSFLFYLFNSLCKLTLTKSDQGFDEEYDRLISQIDSGYIKGKYKDAVKIFETDIYFDGFNSSVHRTIDMKCGNATIQLAPRDILDNSPRDGNIKSIPKANKVVTLYSLDSKPLEVLVKFLDSLGKIEDTQVYKIYSPEEQILAPYSMYASRTISELIYSESGLRLARRMFAEMEDSNDTASLEYSVSTAGRLGEECLTEIYESLSREPVPPSMTLGALKSSIGKITNGSVRSMKNIAKSDIDTLIKGIKTIDQKSLARVTTKTINFNQQTVGEFVERLNILEGKVGQISILPKNLNANLDSLIKFRNAVSHKSSELIGLSEARKSTYCALSIYLWWEQTKRMVDWSLEKPEIIQHLQKLSTNS